MYARTEIATEITTCGDMQELKLCLMYAWLSYITNFKYYKPFPSRTWKCMHELEFGGGTPSSI
jgi:hypothetical protein